MSEFDTDGTDNIICPHCGYEDHDSWESGGGADEFEENCERCGGVMRVTRHYTISYSSEKMEGHHELLED